MRSCEVTSWTAGCWNSGMRGLVLGMSMWICQEQTVLFRCFLTGQVRRYLVALQPYLSVRVFVLLVSDGVVILLYEPKILLPLPAQNQLSALPVGRQVALQDTRTRVRTQNRTRFDLETG